MKENESFMQISNNMSVIGCGFKQHLPKRFFSVMHVHTLKEIERKSDLFVTFVLQPVSSSTRVVDLTTGVWIPPPDFNVSCLISPFFHSFIGLHTVRSSRVLQGSHTTQLDPLDKPRHPQAFKKYYPFFSYLSYQNKTFCDFFFLIQQDSKCSSKCFF